MKLQVIGEYLFEFMVITVLMCFAIAFVIPFPAVLVGVTGYFKTDIHERRMKDIFKHIKDNGVIIIKYSLFILLLLIFSIFNIFFYNNNPESINEVIYVVSYLLLFFSILCIITSPTIIINMNVNLKQLIFNSFTLIFGSIKNTLIAIIVMAVLVLAVLFFPYVVMLMFYFILYINATLMKENLANLKKKVQGNNEKEITNDDNE